MANLVHLSQPHSLATTDPGPWIADGGRMARKDPQGVLEAIDIKHRAEASSLEAVGQQLRATGQIEIERREALNKALDAAQFDQTRYLRETAQARIDLAMAICFAVINGVLALAVLVGLGPSWITVPLALLVLCT